MTSRICQGLLSEQLSNSCRHWFTIIPHRNPTEKFPLSGSGLDFIFFRTFTLIPIANPLGRGRIFSVYYMNGLFFCGKLVYPDTQCMVYLPTFTIKNAKCR